MVVVILKNQFLYWEKKWKIYRQLLCSYQTHTEILWQPPCVARPVSPYISCKTYKSQQHRSTIGEGHGDRKWHKCWFFPESQDISATDIIPNYTWARTSQTPRGVTDYTKPVPHKPNGAWPDYLQLSATPARAPERQHEARLQAQTFGAAPSVSTCCFVFLYWLFYFFCSVLHFGHPWLFLKVLYK